MIHRRLALALAASLAAAAAVPQDASAAGTVRASCHQDGRIVYREDFPADSPAEKRILIAARHSGAMCVFLDVTGRESMPVPGAAPASPVPDVAGDPDLAAALSVIAEGRTGERYPPSIANAVRGGASPPARIPEAKEGARQAAPAGFLNLTLGIYRGVPLADVMDHWKKMQEGTKVLSRMTPTVSAVDGVIMVSVEGVPDELAASLCEEAAGKGAGCVAVY